jgi:hypothetical protein
MEEEFIVAGDKFEKRLAVGGEGEGEDADLVVAAFGVGKGPDAESVAVLGEDNFVRLPAGSRFTGIAGGGTAVGFESAES